METHNPQYGLFIGRVIKLTMFIFSVTLNVQLLVVLLLVVVVV